LSRYLRAPEHHLNVNSAKDLRFLGKTPILPPPPPPPLSIQTHLGQVFFNKQFTIPAPFVSQFLGACIFLTSLFPASACLPIYFFFLDS
jgi:hypothetical protein